MQWVNSKLQLAGNLLESVDQQAALSLSAEEDASHLLISSLKSKLTGNAAAVDDAEGEEDDAEEQEQEQEQEEAEEDAQRDSATEDTLRNSDRNDPAVSPTSDSTASMPPPTPTSTSTVGSPSDKPEAKKPPVTSTPPISAASASPGTPLRAAVIGSAPSSGSGGKRSSQSSAKVTSGGNDEDTSRLRKEVSRLRNENRLKDLQIANLQKNVQICEEEMEALERECKTRLAEAEQQLSRYHEEKNSDEQNFVQAMELKDAEHRKAQARVEELESETNAHLEKIAQLEQVVAELQESKESLWTTAASASNESEQLIDSLRAELQETLNAMNNLKKEYSDAKLVMYARQTELEKSNTELSNSVAEMEKELEKVRESSSLLNRSGSSVSNGAMNGSAGVGIGLASHLEENERLQQNLIMAKKALQDEARRSEIQKHELAMLTQEITTLKERMEASEEKFAREMMLITRENEELKERVRQASSSNDLSSDSREEVRIQTLTNRLLEKQETIDAYRSKLTTLEVRLADAQKRTALAEEKLQQAQQNGGMFDDVEMAGDRYLNRRSLGGSLRARNNRLSNAISRVAPVVDRSVHVVTALDVFDRWLKFLGRMFLGSPFARLAIICYIGLIHLWVFAILSFHTSHLQEEMETTDAKGGAAGGLPGGGPLPGAGVPNPMGP